MCCQTDFRCCLTAQVVFNKQLPHHNRKQPDNPLPEDYFCLSCLNDSPLPVHPYIHKQNLPIPCTAVQCSKVNPLFQSEHFYNTALQKEQKSLSHCHEHSKRNFQNKAHRHDQNNCCYSSHKTSKKTGSAELCIVTVFPSLLSGMISIHRYVCSFL